METGAADFGPRPMGEVRKELLGRAKKNRNPFLHTIYEEVKPVIEQLQSVDRENWAKAFSSLAKPYEEKGALRKPHERESPPVLVLWGGIDAFKEERKGDAFGSVIDRTSMRSVSRFSAAAPAVIGRPRWPIPIASGSSRRSIRAARRITPSRRSGSSRRSAASIRSSWRKRWRARSAVPRPKNR